MSLFHRVVRASVVLAGAFIFLSENAAAQADGTLLVHVRSRSGPVAQAEARVGEIAVLTDAKGEAVQRRRYRHAHDSACPGASSPSGGRAAGGGRREALHDAR